MFDVLRGACAATLMVGCANGPTASDASDAAAGSTEAGTDAGPNSVDAPGDSLTDSQSTALDASGRKRIFATQTQFSGQFGGLAAADGLCTQAAQAANLGGNWNAWLSDSATTAPSRLKSVGPWFLVDGKTLVFSGPSLSGTPAHDLDMDEHGVTGTKGLVWTGTSATGTGTGIHCSDWSRQGEFGTVGLAGSAEQWTDDQTPGAPCTLHGRLYCVQQ